MVASRRGIELWESEEFDFFDLKGVLEDVFDALGLGKSVSYEGVEGEDGKALDFLHPGKSARIYVMGEEVGYLGELHPALQQELDLSRNVYLFELDLEKLTALEERAPRQFVPLPKYPFLRRDLALIVDEGMVVGDILKEIVRVRSPYVESAQVFDVFTGGTIEPGKKSVAVSLILRAPDRTLTDEEASAVQDKILIRLKEVLGTELRKT